MSDELTPDCGASDPAQPYRPSPRIVFEARQSMSATNVYARALSDRFELVWRTDSARLNNISPDVLLHLIAASDAFQDGAYRTLWLVEPELARSAQTIASLARDSVLQAPSEKRNR
jgi:hypothetical protein